MSSIQHFEYLKYPLYKLYYIDNIEKFNGFTESEVERIKETYAGETLEGIIAALKWAYEKPDIDLTKVLPELPHTNEQIHRYVGIVLKALS
jgi:hypothetical protein